METFAGTFRRPRVLIITMATITAVVLAMWGANFVGAEPNIQIDIKPGSDPNSINCNGANQNEVIAVAILTTPDFDATTVNHITVAFEGASETHIDKDGVARRHVEDVDGDGDLDLVLHFRLGETNLDCDSTLALLTGELFGGVPVEGFDLVNMVSD